MPTVCYKNQNDYHTSLSNRHCYIYSYRTLYTYILIRQNNEGNTLGIISGEAINLSNSMNPSFICCIKSSPPTKSAPAFFASSNLSPVDIKEDNL